MGKASDRTFRAGPFKKGLEAGAAILPRIERAACAADFARCRLSHTPVTSPAPRGCSPTPVTSKGGCPGLADTNYRSRLNRRARAESRRSASDRRPAPEAGSAAPADRRRTGPAAGPSRQGHADPSAPGRIAASAAPAWRAKRPSARRRRARAAGRRGGRAAAADWAPGSGGNSGAGRCWSPVHRQIQMEVVVMEHIRPGPQHGREMPAGAGVRLVQERPFLRVRLLPVAHDDDLAPVGEPEAGHVDRIAEGVLGELRARHVVDRAAGIGAEHVEFGYRDAEPRLRRRLHEPSSQSSIAATIGQSTFNVLSSGSRRPPARRPATDASCRKCPARRSPGFPDIGRRFDRPPRRQTFSACARHAGRSAR